MSSKEPLTALANPPTMGFTLVTSRPHPARMAPHSPLQCRTHLPSGITVVKQIIAPVEWSG